MVKTKNKRHQQKLETKLRILESAKALIAKEGVSGLKTLDVARRAQIAHGSVFAHFPNKEILLLHTIEAFGVSLAKNIHNIASRQKGLQSVLEIHLQILQKNEAFYAALIEGGRQLPEQARETLISIQSAISFHIAKSVELEVAQGLVKEMPAYLLFNTWMGLIHYYLMQRDLFSPQQSVLTDKGDELIAHFMKLIKNN